MIRTSNGYIYRSVDFSGACFVTQPRQAKLHRIVNEQDHHCGLCGAHFVEGDHINLDHIVTVSAGGGSDRANLQATHVACNSARGASSITTRTTVRTTETVTVQHCANCATLQARVAFLERAARTVKADWERMRDDIAEVAKAIGGVPAGKKLPVVLREKLAKQKAAQAGNEKVN